MNKKADKKYMVIIGLVLLVFVIIIMVWFQKSWSSTTNFLLEKNKCKQSVMAASVNIEGIQFSEQIDCPTDYIIIESKDEDKINLKMANSLAECWDNFGRGQLNPFKQEGVFCAVCNIIDFKEKDKKIYGTTKYLFEHNVPSTNLRYVDFLMGFKTSNTDYLDDAEIINKLNTHLTENYIDTNSKYAVVFVQAVGKETISKFKDQVGGTEKATIFAAGTGAVIGGIGAGVICGLATGGVCWGAIAIGGTVVSIASGTATLFGGDDPQWASTIRLIDYDEHSLNALGCEYLPVEQKTT